MVFEMGTNLKRGEIMEYANLPSEEIASKTVERLGGIEGARNFLRGHRLVYDADCRWWPGFGAIYFGVVSDGTTGNGWEKRLGQGGQLGDLARRALRSPEFRASCGRESEVIVLKEKFLAGFCPPNLRSLFSFACERNLIEPSIEDACLIRDKFSNSDIRAMGLRQVVVMHSPFKEPFGNRPLFFATLDNENIWFDMVVADFDREIKWQPDTGFAFIRSPRT